jgi:hypothetical protein
MNRRILCEDCIEELREIIKQCPEEELTDFIGIARTDFICDDCGKEIPEGTECHASTITSPYQAQPYKPWEDEFLIIKKYI